MSHHDPLTTIDPTALDAVAGGVTTSSIASPLATPNAASPLSSMLPLKAGPAGACPCGCGMANCTRR